MPCAGLPRALLRNVGQWIGGRPLLIFRRGEKQWKRFLRRNIRVRRSRAAMQQGTLILFLSNFPDVLNDLIECGDA